jgi:hypothetical protein
MAHLGQGPSGWPTEGGPPGGGPAGGGQPGGGPARDEPNHQAVRALHKINKSTQIEMLALLVSTVKGYNPIQKISNLYVFPEMYIY